MTIVQKRSLQQLIDAAKWPEIKRDTKRILAKTPKNLEALRARAIACHALGERADAKKLLERTLLYHPQDAQTQCDLGVVLAEEGNYTEARRAFIQAIRIDDRYAKAYYNLATTLKRQEDYVAAENILRSCIKLGLADTPAEILFCDILLRQEKMAEAQEQLALVISRNDRDWRVWSNIGYACGSLGDDTSAAVFLAKAYELKPDSVDVLLNYGCYLNRVGRADFAKTILDMAESLAEQDDSRRTAAARWNRSFANFNLRRWDEAWRDYQAGFDCGERSPVRRFAVPEWTGEPLGDRRLMVWCEQGLGDQLQDGFYIKRLLDHHSNVIVETQERLVDLFARSFPEATVRKAARRVDARGIENANDFDLHIPMSNLQMLFGGPETADQELPAYLAVDLERKANWRRFYDETYPDVLRVGLAWRSSKIAPFDRSTENLSLSSWAPVLQVPGVQFFSLAYYDDAAEVASAEAATGTRIHRFSGVDMRNDLEEVTALSAALDITIGTCITPTDIAHAAGCETWWIIPSTGRAVHVHLGRGRGRQRLFVNSVEQEEPAENTLYAVANALREVHANSVQVPACGSARNNGSDSISVQLRTI
jgi:Flp pilus assembly protein TadD